METDGDLPVDAAPDADTGQPDTDTADAGPPPSLTWTTPENISSSATFSDIRLNWGNSVAVTESGTVHVVWREVSDQTGNVITGQIVHRRRDANGWSSVQALSGMVDGVGHPKIAASGNRVYIVWHVFDPDPAGDDRIFFVSSSSDGQAGTFGAPRAVVTDAVVTNASPLQEMASTPSIAATGDWVYVVWADDRVVPDCGFNVSEVYLLASGDRGERWSGELRVTEPDCRSSWTPTVSAWDQYVHVAWTDDRHSSADCGLTGSVCAEEEYYRRLADHGATLDTPEIRLTHDSGPMAQSWAGNIVSRDSYVQYAFMDNAGGDDFQVYHVRSLDRGATWESPLRLLSEPRPSWLSARPTIAAEGSAVHVVWMDVQGDTAATIRHRWSSDYGETWSSVSDVTSGSGVFAIQPSVAAWGGTAHVVWNDQAEIYYASSQ